MDRETKERIKGKLNDWSAQVENLYVQLSSAPEQYDEEFEEEKKSFEEWLKSCAEQIRKFEEMSDAQTLLLRQKLDDLIEGASLGKAGTKRAFQEQRKILSKYIRELKEIVTEDLNPVNRETEHFAEYMNYRLEYFQTRFDILRLKMHLASLDSREAWDERKAELKKQLDLLKSKIREGEQNASGRWEHMRNELGEAWKHLKKAVRE